MKIDYTRTSADFDKLLEITYTFWQNYNEDSRESLEKLKDGLKYFESMDWLAYYDENDKDNMGMINSASVLFAYCKEGTNCKD